MTAWIAGPQFPDVADNLVEEEDDGKPFNIFEYIGRPTAERGVRHKLSGDTARKMGKLDALRILMSIAGDSWEKDLLLGAREEGRGAGQGAGPGTAGTGSQKRWNLGFSAWRRAGTSPRDSRTEVRNILCCLSGFCFYSCPSWRPLRIVLTCWVALNGPFYCHF